MGNNNVKNQNRAGTGISVHQNIKKNNNFIDESHEAE